ncbi:hypothetical protein MPHO_22070 [Mycolicibacterium phocaicum]|nr:hypothetical protein [Mycolicibacterium phocaicum]BBZ55215.1 hypothetical protein MPHO_22070 [Mycolicibacterium phocaicum]
MSRPIDLTHPVVQLLTEHGPLSHDEALQKLQANGVKNPQAVFGEFDSHIDWPMGFLPDDRVVWLPAQLTGKVAMSRAGVARAASTRSATSATSRRRFSNGQIGCTPRLFNM